jgi:hypothetical protein
VYIKYRQQILSMTYSDPRLRVIPGNYRLVYLTHSVLTRVSNSGTKDIANISRRREKT